MFRKKKKEAKIELYELWSLDHTLARIISRYLKAVFRVYQMDYPTMSSTTPSRLPAATSVAGSPTISCRPSQQPADMTL